MKLKTLLPRRKVFIEYRTHSASGDDVLSGFCVWTGEDLKPGDRDCYSIEDELTSYEWDGPDNLIVWYESKWVTG